MSKKFKINLDDIKYRFNIFKLKVENQSNCIPI